MSKQILGSVIALCAAVAVSDAFADAVYGDGEGVFSFQASDDAANEWSETSRWFYSASGAATGALPGSSTDVVLTVPVSAAYPLTWPVGATAVNHFEVGCPRKGTPGDWNLLLPEGAAFTVNGEGVWARNAGTVRMTIEEGASADFKGLLQLGRTANSSAVITNRGTMTVQTLHLGGFNGSLGQIDVFGSLTINGKPTLGNTQSGTTGRLILHEGAAFSKPTVGSSYYFDVGNGGGTVGEFILDGATYAPAGAERINVATGEGSLGRIELKNGAKIDVSSGSGSFYVGYGASSTGEVVISGTSTFTGKSGMHTYLGSGAGSRGSLILSDSASFNTVGDRDLHIGCGQGAYGFLKASGSGYVTSANALFVAEGVGSTGVVSMSGGAYLGSSTTMDFATAADSRAELTITAPSYLWAQRYAHFATGAGSSARIRLEGGEVQLRPYAPVNDYRTFSLGTANSTARLEGWGTFSSHTSTPAADSMTYGIYLDGGQMVADGDGTDRDLVLSCLTDVGTADSVNASGTNGWYAVDHGRVVFPHNRALAEDGSFCVGDYWSKMTPDLVNACAVALTGNGAGAYLHAALYAPDRADVPAGIELAKKDKVLGVWRMGYATGQIGAVPGYAQGFTSASLKFHYDALAAGMGTRYAERYVIETYRYDGTTWQKVAEQENDTDNPLVTLTGITPYADADVPGYNLGWTAIVARYQAPGMVFLLK